MLNVKDKSSKQWLKFKDLTEAANAHLSYFFYVEYGEIEMVKLISRRLLEIGKYDGILEFIYLVAVF